MFLEKNNHWGRLRHFIQTFQDINLLERIGLNQNFVENEAIKVIDTTWKKSKNLVGTKQLSKSVLLGYLYDLFKIPNNTLENIFLQKITIISDKFLSKKHLKRLNVLAENLGISNSRKISFKLQAIERKKCNC